MSDPPPFLNYFYNTLFVFLILPPLFQQILWSPVFHRALSLSVHQSPPEYSVTDQRHLCGRSDLFSRYPVPDIWQRWLSAYHSRSLRTGVQYIWRFLPHCAPAHNPYLLQGIGKCLDRLRIFLYITLPGRKRSIRYIAGFLA